MQLLLDDHKSRRHWGIDSRWAMQRWQATGTLSSPGPPYSSRRSGHLAIALVIVTYCYLGWNVAGYIAGDIVDPQADFAEDHDRGYCLRRRDLSVAERRLSVSAVDHGAGPRTDRTGRREGSRSLVGATERATWSPPFSVSPSQER